MMDSERDPAADRAARKCAEAHGPFLTSDYRCGACVTCAVEGVTAETLDETTSCGFFCDCTEGWETLNALRVEAPHLPASHVGVQHLNGEVVYAFLVLTRPGDPPVEVDVGGRLADDLPDDRVYDEFQAEGQPQGSRSLRSGAWLAPIWPGGAPCAT